MSNITLVQGMLIAILAIVVGVDFWLEALFIFRPIIVCTLTGLILGDIRLGLIAGGLTELAFAGLTPAGGTQPPNPILAGIMTTVIAFTTGKDPATAIGLALPFSFLMQYIILFLYSSFSIFMKNADKYADQANTGKFVRLNMITTAIVALIYGVVAFLCTYVAQDAMQMLVQSMPAWLTHGFEIAGGILPAVGFGMLLKVMLKGEFVPFLIIGFVVASFIQFSNLLPVAIVGTALALFVYNIDKDKEKLLATVKANSRVSSNVEEEDYSDGI